VDQDKSFRNVLQSYAVWKIPIEVNCIYHTDWGRRGKQETHDIPVKNRSKIGHVAVILFQGMPNKNLTLSGNNQNFQ